MRRFVSTVRRELDEIEESVKRVSAKLDETERRLVGPDFLKSLMEKAARRYPEPEKGK